MSFNEYLKLWGALLADMRVLFAIACLFVLGAMMRFIAFGRKSPGGLKRPILKLLEKKAKNEGGGKERSSAASESSEDGEEEGDDIGLTEEEYPTDDDEEPAPKRRKR